MPGLSGGGHPTNPLVRQQMSYVGNMRGTFFYGWNYPGGGYSPTASYPAGTQVGDLCVFWMGCDFNNSLQFMYPVGYTPTTNHASSGSRATASLRGITQWDLDNGCRLNGFATSLADTYTAYKAFVFRDAWTPSLNDSKMNTSNNLEGNYLWLPNTYNGYEDAIVVNWGILDDDVVACTQSNAQGTRYNLDSVGATAYNGACTVYGSWGWRTSIGTAAMSPFVTPTVDKWATNCQIIVRADHLII